MKITIKQFSNYLKCSLPTAKKYYKIYLDALGKKTGILTPYDVSKLDDIPVTECKKLLM